MKRSLRNVGLLLGIVFVLFSTMAPDCGSTTTHECNCPGGGHATCDIGTPNCVCDATGAHCTK
jgi:hypothetical protein